MTIDCSEMEIDCLENVQGAKMFLNHAFGANVTSIYSGYAWSFGGLKSAGIENWFIQPEVSKISDEQGMIERGELVQQKDDLFVLIPQSGLITKQPYFEGKLISCNDLTSENTFL